MIGEYLLAKLVRKAASLSRAGRTDSSKKLYLKIIKITELAFQLAGSVNFIAFIFGSKYPTLVHRIAKIDFVGCLSDIRCLWKKTNFGGWSTNT